MCGRLERGTCALTTPSSGGRKLKLSSAILAVTVQANNLGRMYICTLTYILEVFQNSLLIRSQLKIFHERTKEAKNSYKISKDFETLCIHSPLIPLLNGQQTISLSKKSNHFSETIAVGKTCPLSSPVRTSIKKHPVNLFGLSYLYSSAKIW